MATVTTGHLRMWRLLSSIDSTRPLIHTKVPRVYMWTVPRDARRGDIAVIYSGGAHQSYVAIARLCCDPRMSIDERWWAWLQIQPLLSPVPQADVAAIQGTQGPRTGLNTPRGGSYNEIERRLGRQRFLNRLVKDDPKAGARLHAWRLGKGSWPRSLDLLALSGAEIAEIERQTRRELVLSAALAESLVHAGLARYLEAADRLYDRSLEVTLTFEDGSRGRADILLVSLAHHRPTLLLIEVKCTAMPWPTRNPVDQLLVYEPVVRRDSRGRFRVLRWAIAEHFHPLVLGQARRLKIPCSRCSADGREIRLLDGRGLSSPESLLLDRAHGGGR